MKYKCRSCGTFEEGVGVYNFADGRLFYVTNNAPVDCLRCGREEFEKVK